MDKIEIQLGKEKSCVGKFIGWERLQNVLRSSANLREGEEITHVKIDKRGLGYFVKDKHPKAL